MQTFSMFNISYSPGLWAFKITIKFRSKSLAMKKEILASVTNTNFNLDCLYSYNVEVLHLQYTKGNNTWWGGLEAIIHSIIICADIILSDNSHHCSLKPLHITVDSIVLLFQFSMIQSQLILIPQFAVNTGF